MAACMVECCKQRGSSETASSSSSESVSAEHRGSQPAGGAAPQGQEAVESAWLSEDSDTGEAEAAAGPSEDVPFYDPEYAGLLSAGFTKLIGV